MVTVLEAASRARITKQKVRYWLDLLEVETTRKEGKIYLPAAAVDLLDAMQKAVAAGVSPAVAAAEIKNVQPLPTLDTPAPICNQDNNQAELADLKNAIMLLVETVERQARQIEHLTDKLDTVTAKLLPAPSTKPVNVWQPCRRSAPKVSWLRRAWLELVDPVQLRATP